MLIKWLLIGSAIYLVWRLTRGFISSGNEPRRPESPPYNPPRELDPHDVLGVPRGASRKEIHAAYQQKILQYHPDKVADLGDELKEVAERRTKEINAAYAELKGR